MDNINILLVEDTPLNQIIALQLLKNLGYDSVTCVNNGLEALKELNQNHYNLILMDCLMPVLDGYETTKILRQRQDQYQYPIIIAMTANDLPEDKDKCLEVGMDDYISKPLELDKLATIIQHWSKMIQGKDSNSLDSLITQLQSQKNNIQVELSSSLIEEIPIDLERFHKISRGNQALQTQLISNFIKSALSYLKESQQALQKQDWLTLLHRAHQLKGSSQMIGVLNIPTLAAALETQAQNQQIETIPELLVKIEIIVIAVQTFFKLNLENN